MIPRVLLVEDNPSIIKLVRDLLSAHGYEVAATGEAHAVRRLVRETRPHLVLMDLNLPRADGLSLVRELKNDPEVREIKVVAFTARAMAEDREQALSSGCDGFISKPVHVASFLRDVRSYVGIEPTPPVAASQAPAMAPDNPAYVRSGEGRRILVVDDSPDVSQLLAAILEIEGYQVHLAPDGRQALMAVEHAVPDLVMVDVSMPRMSGFEVVHRLRGQEATQAIPIVMLSGHDDPEKRRCGLESGADDFIIKPFNKTQLLDRIRALLVKAR